ncbi:MAG: PKD domain-containing protein [Bdellovibrionaceae bacterium]|nr:PKD domain-containing protein [Pseudobdellovibrionaceae bacterium]
MDVIKNMIAILGLGLVLTACQGGRDGGKAGTTTEASVFAESVEAQPVISGPQVAMVGYAAQFDLMQSASVTIVGAIWNFGDSASIESSMGPINHTYNRPGTYTITAEITDASESKTMLTRTVKVLPIQDGLECVTGLAIISPAQAETALPVSTTVNIPSCLATTVTSIQWNFGDGSNLVSGQTAQHTYTVPGTYTISVDLFTGGSDQKWVTLTTTVVVKDPVVVPVPTPAPSATPEATPAPSATPEATPAPSATPEATPAPSATPEATPAPSATPEATPAPSATPEATPAPTPNPTPTPNPLACPLIGGTRDHLGNSYTQTESCGMGGTRKVTYRQRITERCDFMGGEILWNVISTIQEVQDRGACTGEYCRLDDGSQLASGEMRTVVIGEVKTPLTCSFGEQGYENIFTQIADMSCKDGILTSMNSRQGDIKSQGQCPTYSFVKTNEWTACSADCGGQQSLISECRSNTGVLVSADYCAGQQAQVENRVCDGNPEAVRRTEQVVTQEDGSCSAKCPKNQIGVVVNQRDITTTKMYACINHQVQLESENVNKGAWQTEKYCRDFVAHRCSQDSLSNSKAQARYQWMVKCQDQVPVIKEFLTNFSNLNKTPKGSKLTINNGGKSKQQMYPTFMNRATSPETPWIAPTNPSASCAVPATAYIAAVCVSSCATPEQQILTEIEKKNDLKYVSFIEAFTQKYKRVATMASSDSMSEKRVMRTKVQQWVTELIDTNQEIIDFKMKSGRSLRLTPNHPVVAADGSLKLAADFEVGESLVELGGKLDEIVSAERINYFGKVYNLFVQSAEIHKNIVITNGYLNGTAYFQNQGAENMNRKIFKNNLTAGIFK